jgi:amidase/aspartyl-tRNA(Asn)/glutamyl-tRNA(Gln) amidotransferase subunit A
MSLRNGAALSEEEVQAAHERRTEYRVLLDRLLAEFDVLLAPAVPTPPPLIGQDEVTLLEGPQVLRRAVLRLNTPFSLLGAPVLSLPSSVPDVGVQLVGRHGQDERLLGLGLSLES